MAKEQSVKITGNLMNAYFICKRKLWLYSREVSPGKENTYLQLGTLIGKESYKRDKKEILLGSIKIDLVKRGENSLVIAEVKKSSAGKKAARMQLLFYLYRLKEIGISAEGELLVPKERKKEKVILSEEAEEKVKNAISDIQKIIALEMPPPAVKTHFCNKCAYKDFCFA